ncbi:unnamed protein product [Symbiodinium sp. CCMP2456]|nr:unnamed protein product [Symbiodinium sp. CCMP2456]
MSSELAAAFFTSSFLVSSKSIVQACYFHSMLMASRILGLALLCCVVQGMRKGDVQFHEGGTVETGVTVRETEQPSLSINYPVDPARLQEKIGKRLEPDVYDGKAFVQVSVFFKSRVEMKAPVVGFVPTGMSSWGLRMSTYVKKDGEKGFVVLSVDVESSLMSTGCSWTQTEKGTKCGSAKVTEHSFLPQNEDPKMANITVVEGTAELLSLRAELSDTVSNEPFQEWANNRTARFRVFGENLENLERGVQNERLFEGKHQVKMDSYFSSAIFRTKSYFGESWSDLDHTDPCREGYCFLYSKFQFVDYEGVKVEDAA